MVEQLNQPQPGSDQTEAVREHFERAMRLVKHARLGLTPQDRRGLFLAATTELEKVLQLDQNFPGARTSLGYCLIELGRHGEAKREIERALLEFPKDVSAVMNYAIILHHTQSFGEAESYLRRAISLDPSRGLIYRELAYLLEHRKKYRAAADNLERYLELVPQANDERSIRKRIKLLRRWAGHFQLPDRMMTSRGVASDLRLRGAAFLLDALVVAALWQMTVSISTTLPRVASLFAPLLVSVVYLYHLLCMEVWGGTLGKILLNLHVPDGGEAWYSRRALRETLKLGPILIACLLPFPSSLIPLTVFMLAAVYSALRNRQGQSWYDRLASTLVVEWDYRWYRVLAGLGCLGSLILGVLCAFA